MKILKKLLFLVVLLIFGSSALAFSGTKITPLDAKKKTFGKVCGTKYSTYIPLEPIVRSKTWAEDEGTPLAVDTLVSDTSDYCKAMERYIKDAYNVMKNNWYTKCRSENCRPGNIHNTYDANTNCDSGEVKVTNVHNSSMFCVYDVSSGSAQPKRFDRREGERCYVGEDPDSTSGYGSATVSIPEAGANRSYYMLLHCRPINTVHYYPDLSKLEDYDDEEDPKVPEKPK